MPVQLNIVTPEKQVFSDEVDWVVVPGTEGEMGVLPHHAALVTTLKPGELRYGKGGDTTDLAVGDGVVEVLDSTVSVITDMAMGEHEVDEEMVEKALEHARESLNQLSGDEEIAAVQASIQKSLAQLHLKRKRRRV